MYESPIQMIVDKIQTQMIQREENSLLLQVQQSLGFDIDKNELLRALNYDRDQYKKGYRDGRHDASWIPVSERLPEKDEYGKVLVTYIPSGGTLWTTVIIAYYSDLMGIAKPSFHIGEVGKENFQNITKQVIAWIPLPEPYRAESEE